MQPWITRQLSIVPSCPREKVPSVVRYASVNRPNTGERILYTSEPEHHTMLHPIPLLVPILNPCTPMSTPVKCLAHARSLIMVELFHQIGSPSKMQSHSQSLSPRALRTRSKARAIPHNTVRMAQPATAMHAAHPAMSRVNSRSRPIYVAHCCASATCSTDDTLHTRAENADFPIIFLCPVDHASHVTCCEAVLV